MPVERTPAEIQLDARRRSARRTALLFGGVALAVYLGFLMSGVVGR